MKFFMSIRDGEFIEASLKLSESYSRRTVSTTLNQNTFQ
jgi:hypothetical protein